MALDNFKKTSMRIDKANQRFLDYQNAKVGDVNGRELLVQITNNGVVEDQTGTTLKLNWQHENGNQGSTSFSAVDIKQGKYSLYYPKEMLYKGSVDASVEINSNGQTTNTMNFKIVVHADVFNGEAGTVDGVFISLADVNKKLDDREKEYVELKERQTSVETQFDAVQQELTDKDPISAPEIIAARNGEANLKARLDKEHQNVTAQLAQNKSYMAEQLTDFVALADNSKRTDLPSYVLVTGDRNFRVHMPIDDNKYQQWRMEKNANDDFIILSAGFLSTKTETPSDVGSKPYDSKEGSFNEASVSSAYTSQIGSKLYFRFKGVGLKFIHVAENRGGMWKFVVDGNESDAKFVSTYSTTSVTSKLSDVFDDLDNTFHNVVATFIGDDPNNPPSSGVGTARGWYHATATFRIIDSGLSFGDNQPIFSATSNKEFAIGIQPQGVTQRQWIPEHNGIGTLFATEQKMYIDDELVTSWANNGLQEFKTITLTQSLLAKHPDHPTNLIQVDTIHTFNGKNVFVKSKLKVLEPVNLNGYSMMSPIFPKNVQKVVTANDTYNVGGTINEDFNTPKTPFSFLFLSTVYKNYVGATTISEPKKTFRIGESGTRNPLIFLENRSTNMAKVYPQVLNSYDAEVGEVFEFSGYYTIGKMVDAERYFN